jgi:uncharacterized membrane protein
MQNPPPVQVNSQPPMQAGKSSTGLDENIAAPLSYVATWLSGLIFFLIEKDSRLVRFHAMQSILLGATMVVLFIAVWLLSLISWVVIGQISGLLSFLVNVVLGLVTFVLIVGLLVAVVICLIKAYQRQYFKLPVIGNLAEKYSAK